MDWLRRILAALFGSRSDDTVDDRRPTEVATSGGMADDLTPMNASGSPDDRNEVDANDDGGDGGDGGSDD
ncbi:MAG: hypothetical protein AB1736_11900 [Chloroflexota bacterium]